MDKDFQTFIEGILQKTGIDLSSYKEPQMKRRLKSQYEKRGLSSFVEYYNQIELDKELYYEFLDRMTINVSEFYRNGKRWDDLDQHILPDLLSRNKRLKVWSAACSSGEEPYTLAMLLLKHVPNGQFSILATDLDENILQKARLGIYEERAFANLPKEYLQKYFTKEEKYYKVDEQLKKAVTFKKHNLLADRFEQNFDLIVCRNVLIYFTEAAKEQVFGKFVQSIKNEGYLFIGSTEQIFSPEQFHLKNTYPFFYKKVLE